MKKSRKSPRKRPRRTLQRMGGKEERISQVGKVRAEVERSEEEGEARFDVAPGPPTEELLRPTRRPKMPGAAARLPRKKVSSRRRGGPEGFEPEDVKRATRKREGLLSRETLPFEHDDLDS